MTAPVHEEFGGLCLMTGTATASEDFTTGHVKKGHAIERRTQCRKPIAWNIPATGSFYIEDRCLC